MQLNLPTHIRDLDGLVKVVTSVPAYKPKKFDQQIVIYVDDISSPTTVRMYIFAPRANSWYYVALT
jgi:hypothetical protein